jgi:dienelactone hydrolase
MPDALVEVALHHWWPRILAQGVDYNDFKNTTARTERYEDWLDEWCKTAQMHHDIAEEAEQKGRLRTAGEAYLRASLCYHFAKYLWLIDPAKYRATTEKSVAALIKGQRILDPTFERLEIPFDRDKIPANLRKPKGVDKPPVVILVPGLDSVKEEFPNWEESFLNRGMATVAMDGPGQGEGGFVNGLRSDYEAPVGAVIDVIAGRGDLDTSRIGISGVSLGGYYAPRAAAFEPRIKAVAVVGGPYNLGSTWHLYPPMIKTKFMYDSQIDDEERARQHALTFTLEGVASRVQQPFLVVFGKLDTMMSWQEAKRGADEAPRGEFLLYEDGTHVCYTVNYKFKPYLADWMKEKLG